MWVTKPVWNSSRETHFFKFSIRSRQCLNHFQEFFHFLFLYCVKCWELSIFSKNPIAKKSQRISRKKIDEVGTRTPRGEPRAFPTPSPTTEPPRRFSISWSFFTPILFQKTHFLRFGGKKLTFCEVVSYGGVQNQSSRKRPQVTCGRLWLFVAAVSFALDHIWHLWLFTQKLFWGFFLSLSMHCMCSRCQKWIQNAKICQKSAPRWPMSVVCWQLLRATANDRKRPQTTASGRKWPQTTANGLERPQVTTTITPVFGVGDFIDLCILSYLQL